MRKKTYFSPAAELLFIRIERNILSYTGGLNKGTGEVEDTTIDDEFGW